MKTPIFVNLETQTHYPTAVVMEFYGTQASLEAAARRALGHIDPNLVILNLRSLDDELLSNSSQEQSIAALFELRMAFGADRRRVIGLVTRSAFVLAAGVLLGIPIGLARAHSVAAALYGVKPYDPVSLLAAIVALLAAAALASFVPARRASSIDPMRALRGE